MFYSVIQCLQKKLFTLYVPFALGGVQREQFMIVLIFRADSLFHNRMAVHSLRR